MSKAGAPAALMTPRTSRPNSEISLPTPRWASCKNPWWNSFSCIPHSTQVQRSRSFCPQEHANVAEARVRFSQAQTPEDKARRGKALYRRKRKWLNWVACRRFDFSADKLSPSDRSSARQVRWLDDGSGDRVCDTAQWPSTARPFFSDLYTSVLESTDSKRSHPAQLEDVCAAARLDGTKRHVHLPRYVLLDSRQDVPQQTMRFGSNRFGDVRVLRPRTSGGHPFRSLRSV